MPTSYDILDDPFLVVVRFEGHVTLEESAASFIDYLQSGAAYSGRPVLLDSSAVTVLDIDFQDMLTFIGEKLALIDPYERTMIMGVYAPRDDLYAQWREYAALVSTSERQIVAVFRDRGEALRFCGVSPVPQAEPQEV